LGRSHAKTARPLRRHRPIHLVMKSRMAIGSRSMLSPKHAEAIRHLLDRQARKFSIKVFHYANGGHHIHMILKISTRVKFANFLRAITGLIARRILGAEKHRQKLTRHLRFWVSRPFTRVASWGRPYLILVNYLRLINLRPGAARLEYLEKNRIIIFCLPTHIDSRMCRA
jgi:REP element-mobilizing transposase RayT